MTGEVTIPGKTIPELVEYWGSTPENETPAFVSIHANGEKRAVTRKGVLAFSKRFAYKLHQSGIKKGDIVCNALPNSLERVVCEFGIQFSGATSLNGQVLRSDGEDFSTALEISQCTAVIVDPFVAKGAYQVLYKEGLFDGQCPVDLPRFPQLKKVVIVIRDDRNSKIDFMSSLKDPDLPQFRADVSPTDLATVMTTSGSTGYSKLVKHSQANICHFCKQVKAIEPLPSGAHFLNCAQLGWAGGYPQWYLSCGVTRYIIDVHDGPPADTPSLLWKILVEEKIVYGFLTPMFVNAILTQCPWQTAEWKPKVLCLAGQPLKKESLNIIGKLCEAVDVNYGMTECNVVTTHRVVDPAHFADGCAGYPGYEVKFKVVDANKQVLPRGTMGEIMIWSPSLCLGYMNNESDRTSAFTEDGWFCTDDAGYVGKDGKVYVEGRQSDSIHRGVYILYPGWLEKKMRQLSEVNDIVIVAVPDKVLFNEICACVVVTGVKGVVAGCLHSTDSNMDRKSTTYSHNQLDIHEVDADVLLQHSQISYNKPVACSSWNTETDDAKNKPTIESNHKQLNQNSPLDLNMRQVSMSSSEKRETNEGSAHNLNLVLLENQLRSVAIDLNMLHENDAMRMVPKYYVFMEAFPTTSTGKISRKEIRTMAAAALKLE